MKTTLGLGFRILRGRITRSTLAAFAAALVAALPPAAAQAGTGSIAGTVANSATRQFLTDAEVKVAGTNISTLTDRDGTFTIRNLAPGSYTLEVSYTGLDSEKRIVDLTAGQTARLEFNLTSGIYKLAAFTVAAEAEGNAAAINQQKKADFFVQAISTDTLGVVPDGNIGEFLRYVPGIQVNFVNADASTVSMRGQDPESTVFTFDGQIPAAAGTPPRSSTGSSDTSSRAFEFSQATINNIETIEVYKAPPPWMAPSTGGVVNAVTKNAFAQKGRRFSTTFTLSANSEMLHLGKVPGPGARPTSRIKPGGSINYSEALLNNTLGISLSYFESNVINPQHNYAMGYSPFTAGTAANPVTDASRFNVNTFTLVDGPQVKNRRTIGVNTDYKLGAHTVLKLRTSFNGYLNQSRSHTFRVRPGTIDAASTTTDAIDTQRARRRVRRLQRSGRPELWLRRRDRASDRSVENRILRQLREVRLQGDRPAIDDPIGSVQSRRRPGRRLSHDGRSGYTGAADARADRGSGSLRSAQLHEHDRALAADVSAVPERSDLEFEARCEARLHGLPLSLRSSRGREPLPASPAETGRPDRAQLPRTRRHRRHGR